MIEHATSPDAIAHLAPAGVPTAAGVLARAMTEDPGWIHLFPDPATRRRRLTRVFELAVGRLYLDLGESFAVDGAAAAIWAPPGTHAVPWSAALGLIPRLGWLIGRRTPAALRMYREMARRAPREPHHYLAALGVDPAHQGRGLGAAIIQPVLDRCDQTRTLAWLESTNPRNHAFYRRVGFVSADELAIPGGPTVTWYARAAR